MIDKDQQRADFEAFAQAHFAEFGQVPDLTRARLQSLNYNDPDVNSMWWGWQAGQEALLVRREDRRNE